MFEQRFHHTHDHGGDSMWRPPKKSIWNWLCIWISPRFSTRQTPDNEVKYNDFIPFCTTILLIVLLYTVSISKEWFQWVYYFSCSQKLKVVPTRTPVTNDHGHQESMLTLRRVLAVSRRHVGDGNVDIDFCWLFKITCNSGWTHLKESWNLFFLCVLPQTFWGCLCQYPVNPWPQEAYMRLGDQHTGFMLWNFDCGDKQQIGSHNGMRT